MTENSASQSSAVSSLSKSQKKRLKRNNTKAKKADEQETARKKIPDMGPLNPLDKVRMVLKQRGFSLDEIDNALEEMWNSELVYDDVDAVQNYLILRADSGRASSQSNDNSKEPDLSTQSLESSYSESASTEATESFKPMDETHGVSEAKSESVEIVGDTLDASIKNDRSASVTSHSEPMDTLSSKLDIVANYENLNDAIMALSEWVCKSATLAEVRPFYFKSQPTFSSNFVIHHCVPSR